MLKMIFPSKITYTRSFFGPKILHGVTVDHPKLLGNVVTPKTINISHWYKQKISRNLCFLALPSVEPG